MSQTTLKPEAVKWIDGAIGGVDMIDAAVALLHRKELLLDAARTRIERGVGTISVGEDFVVEMKTSGVEDFIRQKLDRKLLMASIGEDADPNEDFDTGHDLPKMKGMSGDDFKRLIDAQALIATEVENLRKAFDQATRKPLFTDREISDAVWEPLKRRKLIPENAIPDRYSEVSRTFEGASGAYQERLAAYTDGLGKFDKLCQSLGIAKDIIEAAATVATSTIADLTTAGVSDFDPMKARDCITLIQVTLSGGIDTTTEILGIVDDDEMSFKMKIAKSAVAICKQAGNMASASAGVAFGDSDYDLSVGVIIKDSITMAVLSGSAAVKLADGDYEGMLADIADIVAAATDCATNQSYLATASKTERDINADQNAVGTVTTGDIGRFIADGIKAGGAGGKVFINAIKKGKLSPEEVAEFLGKALQLAVDAGSSWYAEQQQVKKLTEANDKDTANTKSDDEDKRDEGEDRRDYKDTELNEIQEIGDRQQEGSNAEGFAAIGDIVKQIQSKQGDELEKLLQENPQFRALAKTIKTQQAAVIEDANKNLEAQVAQEAKAFRDLLQRGETGDMEGEIRSIELMILIIKRDQMLWDLAEKLISMPAQVVAAFLPQAGIAVSGIQLIKSLKLAAEHAMALVEWRQNVADARAAMSVQAEAMINRSGLEAKHTMEHSLQALNSAVLIVGGALACAGPFAPAGHITTSTYKAVVTVGQTLYKYYEKRELRKNWKIYLKALDNPDDRKTIRKAIRGNPTLAKYVIAYGAEEENNPVARNVMRKCGLSAEVLDSKGTNVQKVEAYLEALFPEDPVLLVAVSRPKAWWPGQLELTSASVAAFAGAAENLAKGQKLKPGSCKDVIILLTQLETLDVTYRDAFTKWRKAGQELGQADDPNDPTRVKKLQDALHSLQTLVGKRGAAAERLVNTLKGAAPVGTDGKPHTEMLGVLKLLLPNTARLVANYKREGEALGAQDGAYDMNPDNWESGKPKTEQT